MEWPRRQLPCAAQRPAFPAPRRLIGGIRSTSVRSPATAAFAARTRPFRSAPVSGRHRRPGRTAVLGSAERPGQVAVSGRPLRRGGRDPARSSRAGRKGTWLRGARRGTKPQQPRADLQGPTALRGCGAAAPARHGHRGHEARQRRSRPHEEHRRSGPAIRSRRQPCRGRAAVSARDRLAAATCRAAVRRCGRHPGRAGVGLFPARSHRRREPLMQRSYASVVAQARARR